MARLLFLILASLNAVQQVAADCLANKALNDEFASFIPAETIPTEGSCCMKDVCGLPCPTPVEPVSNGYGIAVAIFIGISFLVGMATYFFIKGDAQNYFVAGKSLPLWIVATTLGAQAVDVNSLLTNADLAYKFHFYDGLCIPIGIAGSLILNAIFLAKHVNAEENVLTLPDILSRRYGKTVEVIVSITTITSFLMLLAGNLVGLGTITSYVWGIDQELAIWIAAVIVWAYTVSGGLFSVAYTDVVQGAIGWTGCLALAYYLIANEENQYPPVSIGFPGYVYPDASSCEMYDGVACSVDTTQCCYNAEKWCPSDDNCRADNGAYPFGDQRIFNGQMFDPLALAPFPNAIFWNWCTVIILAFGNLGALDFQVRCMAADSPRNAQIGCWIGGLFCLFIGIPFSYLGSITRFYYGPDSIHAEFAADTCSTLLGLPTCGAWVPDPNAFINLLTHEAPPFLGAWCLVGIVAASMSTADGAILAMGTVFSHNIMRQLDGFYPNLVTSKNLLFVARLSTIPLALTSTLIAAYYKSTSSSAGATGYLLIVAFDIVLATTVAPIFGCFYVKNPSPRAAFCSTMLGVVVRVVLEFTLPKDGFLLLPYDEPEFLDYGPAASSLFPPFFDEAPENLWNATAEPCTQERFEDYTGTDSMAAFVCSILAFVIVQAIENKTGKPLFSFPGMDPYEKDLGNESGKASEDVGKKVPGEDSDKGVPGEEVDEEESLEADA